MTDTDQPYEYFVSPVGIVHSPYETPDEAPHQGFAADAESELEVFKAHADALAGIENVLRLTVVYWAHRADRSEHRNHAELGAFARRGPNRPNPLSICTCTILDVDGRRIRVTGLDAIDESTLVDLKPALQVER